MNHVIRVVTSGSNIITLFAGNIGLFGVPAPNSPFDGQLALASAVKVSLKNDIAVEAFPQTVETSRVQ